MSFLNNDFNILDIENKTNTRTQLSNSSYKKYAKILNNLLGIKSRSDYAIFTRLNSLNVDLLNLVKFEDINKIYSKNQFKIKLEKKIVRMNKNSSSMRIDDETLFINKWKRYIKEVNETFMQTNMWPLFVGTYFLKGKIGEKQIYAPLVLKEIEISIEDNEVYLISRNSSISLNEKLIFLLEEFQGITIPNIKSEIEKASIDDIASELNKYLRNVVEFEYFEMSEKFKELSPYEVNNNRIIRTSGIVLLFAQPLGGILRNVVVDLIKEDKMKNLININLDNSLASDEQSIRNIVYKPKSIARICPTDPSQENAIISSLKDHTIIIGPPGTGKSQTIANILVNIIKENKKALFISQKRIALEVVLERMKSLQYFTLQLVEQKSKSSNLEKNIFYEYMNNFFNMIRNVNINSKIVNLNVNEKDINLKPLVSYKKLEYWKTKDLQNNLSQYDVDLFCKMKSENIKINSNLFKDLNNCFSTFKQISRFDEIEKIIDLKEKRIKDFANKLNVIPKFQFLGIKKYDKSFKKFFRVNLDLLNIIDLYNLNKNLIMNLRDYVKYDNILKLDSFYELHSDEIPKNNSFFSNEKQIAEMVALRAQSTYRKIHSQDPTWSKKFKGRIERKFAQPNKFINIFKKELKQLFNIYVSTPEALSSFIDFKKDRFDYVIFDEASQIFLEKAIPYISIADKVIVAGDDQQMQPSNWFGNRMDVDEEDKEEENIDSLLTYAIEQGIKKEMLELNYRSASAILTTFSSKEFYESNLKTLDSNDGITRNPIEIINVNGKWENNKNEVEAKKAIEILKNNVNKYSKIILLTLNKQQMDLINLILSLEEPSIYNKIMNGEIVLKNLENIQGDEADLVIVSIGYTKDTALSMTYVGRPGGRNALNVAITRAKEKMIIVKSISSSEIQTKSEMNKDLRTFKNWIEFLELSEQDQKLYSIKDESNIQSIESNFENEVVNWLKTKKFKKQLKLVLQYPIGSYRIDVALLDSQTDKFVLGIEVDGFLYHSTIKQRYNDLVRQNFIEAKGYKLIRISELLWKTNKEKIWKLIDSNI